jgi:hypothetical protein
VLQLEDRVAPALAFPGISGITFDTSGDVFVSYDSTTPFSNQQQSVAEVSRSGQLIDAAVFGTTGSSAFPGALTTVGSSASLPNINSAGDILELQPNGQLFVFDPSTGGASQYADLSSYTANASNVYDVQTGANTNLSSQISLTGATFGDFGVYGNSLAVSAESNNWDFVVRLTFGSSGGVATILVASPASDGRSASPGGVAVDSQGTVLASLPYVPAGSSTAIHVPVGFSLSYDTGSSPAPFVPTLGLTTLQDIDSAAITVDSQNNFILALTNSSLYGGGPGVAHINSALSAFLADPLPDSTTVPTGITFQTVAGTNSLAIANATLETYTVAGELPLFSGQVNPAQLRRAYGIDQIRFTSPGGITVTGDGSGQTIAIVEEGADPTIGADLNTFDQFYGIPAPPSFQVINQNGVSTPNLDIVGEASLDVEWAHAVAPGASIIVYNSEYNPNDPTGSFENLLKAMQQASKLPGVSVVTLSYGEAEYDVTASGLSEQSLDANFTTAGVTFVAAAGDSGIFGNGGSRIAADYPAASPNIVSVGGTSIVIDSAGNYPGTGAAGEVAWGDGINSGTSGGGGGGLSSVEPEPAWQQGVVSSSIDSSGTRAVPDVAMDSGSAQEYDVFTSTLSGSTVSALAVGWLGDAGTSAAAPIWAGLIAIANQGRVLAGGAPLSGNTQTLPALYSLPAADFHDIVNGNNGDPALPGYDLASGLGTPVANLLVPDLAGYEIPTQFAIKTEPPSSVAAGSLFGLTVLVQDSLGNAVSGGTVTVAIANNPGNATLEGTRTLPVKNGLATFSGLILSQPGTSYTLTITDSGIAGALTTTAINVTPGGQSGATLSLSNLNVTYDGSPHRAQVTTSPAGLSGVTVTYAQNGMAVASPTRAGAYTVTATLNNPNYTAQPVMATLEIGQASPTITWATPANITVGTPLGAAQLDAVASFAGTPIPGVFAYTPQTGSMLAAGNGQTLNVSFAPSDATDFKTVTASVTISVVPQSMPPPRQATVIGEKPVFRRKLNKFGKPVGKPALIGYELDFNTSLDAAAASNPGNYQLGVVAIKTVKAKRIRVLQSIKTFTVSYSAAGDSVTLKLTHSQLFPKGGQIKVLPGVTGASGSVLSGHTAFSITPGGKKIKPS